MRTEYARGSGYRLAGGLLVLLLIFAGGLPAQANQTAPAAQPDTRRLLSVSMLPYLEPAPKDNSEMLQRYMQAIDLAYNAGARGDVLTKHWRELEPTTGRFALEDLINGLKYTGVVRGFSFLFGIQLINTTQREVPDDLKTVPFDSPQMKARFHILIDTIAPTLDSHVLYLSIGNEVDAYLGSTNQWTAYQAFYEDALDYIHQKLPGIKVGVTVTFDGATKRYPEEVRRLTEKSDIYIATYYPLNPDFTVRSPDSPGTDFPLLLNLAGTRPLVMQEVGYPAAESLGSSETKQAAFVNAVYKAWEQADNRIPLLNFFLEHDFSASMCQDFLKYYGLPNVQHFYDYLCTLGLRKADGTPRRAWTAFVAGAKAAGFP